MLSKIYTLPCLFILTVSNLFAVEDISDSEMRLYESMNIEELLNTEIATGVPVSQKLAPAATSIITSDEIRKSGARTLHEVLEQIPGIHIYPSDVDLMTPKVNIRGIATGFNAQVLFLLDGVPMNDLLNGHPGYAFRMPVSIVNRIEVIRGPGSALHGADAFAGVVNIITKKSDTISDEVGVRYGSFNTFEMWMNKSIQESNYSLGLALSMMKSDGDEDRIITQDASGASGEVQSRYKSAFVHADLHYEDFDVNVLLERARDLGLGDGHLHIVDPKGDIDRSRVITDITHKNDDLLDDTVIKTKLSFSYLDSKPTYYPRNAWQIGQPFAEEYVGEFSTGGVYRGIDQHTIQLRAGYKYGKLDPTQFKNFGPGVTQGVLTEITDNPALGYMLEETRESYYALLQDEYKIVDTLTLTAGVRYDDYDDFGSTVNPRLALVWEADDALMVKLMYGKAFRAPSFGELYLINNPQLSGNPDLSPEKIDTYELAFNYEGVVNSRLNLFYYDAKDMIDYVGPTPSQAENINEQESMGAELELEYSFSEAYGVRGNYSYLHSENRVVNTRTPNIPNHQAFVEFEYSPEPTWNMNAQYFFIGKRHRPSTDTRDDLDAYSLVNLTLEKRELLDGLDALVSVRNLFDEDYSEPSIASVPNDYPMEGVSFFAELRYNF